MIDIFNDAVLGWGAAIRGMRNPKNSWDKSDSHLEPVAVNLEKNIIVYSNDCILGINDLTLMKRLANAGTDHGKFLRMITVYADIIAPLYWWKEYDTYKVGTVANSCSTMHKLTSKELTPDDFSHDRLQSSRGYQILLDLIDELNENRKAYKQVDDPLLKKKYFDNMIQLLPSSYNQKRTVMLNYTVLKKIYHARKDHKLDEWRSFCHWIETLPHSEIITEKEA